MNLASLELLTENLKSAPEQASVGLKRRGPSRNTRLQYLRAVAASAVVVFHASEFVRAKRGDSTFATFFDGRFGVYGVAIFFAISGYLMARLIRANDPWSFLAHRILRIYPIYLLVVLCWVGVSALLGSRPNIDVISLILVPNKGQPYPIGIEWTLVFETTYYVLLFLLASAGLQRWLEAIAIGWIGAVCAVHLFAPAWVGGLLFPFYLILLSPANVAFAVGLLLPALIRRELLPPAIVWIVAPAFLLYGHLDLNTDRLMAGFLAPLLVLWAVRAMDDKPPSKWSAVLVAQGDWSYALYLCHVPVILTVIQVWPAQGNTTALWVVAILRLSW